MSTTPIPSGPNDLAHARVPLLRTEVPGPRARSYIARTAR